MSFNNVNNNTSIFTTIVNSIVGFFDGLKEGAKKVAAVFKEIIEVNFGEDHAPRSKKVDDNDSGLNKYSQIDQKRLDKTEKRVNNLFEQF